MNSKLKKILIEIFNINETELNESLTKEDISNWDSLKHMDLVVTLEKEYNMTLEMEEIINLNSVKTIISTLKNKGINV
tara:strand:- start:250 stop:483 length:234 start_codon:yes stop_codon:yes gene_type:complete